jgi:N-acetylmuramoyl-L-alanine amidase
MFKENTSRAIFMFFCFVLTFSLVITAMLTFSAITAGVSKNATETLYADHTIILDPGHGGIDGGAVGFGGVVEKGINLSISLKMRAFFQAAGYRVIMTREDDRSIHDENSSTIKGKKTSDLKNRLDFIKNNPKAVFLSVHQNIFEESIYSGTQVFYSPNNELSKLLAKQIQLDIKSMLQPQNNREIKEAGKNLFLLYKAQSPAVLIECGFLYNPKEAQDLQNDDYQNKMAFACFLATMHYYANFT